MSILSLLLIITTAWIIYHFMIASRSEQVDKAVVLRKLGYGKSIGLFALVIGVLGQMIGFSGMFGTIEAITNTGQQILPGMVFGGIRATMICTVYGILIYLFSLLLWFVTSILIEKRQADQLSA